jgi:hypothetical protein
MKFSVYLKKYWFVLPPVVLLRGGHVLAYVSGACLPMVVSNTYCIVFVICFICRRLVSCEPSVLSNFYKSHVITTKGDNKLNIEKPT